MPDFQELVGLSDCTIDVITLNKQAGAAWSAFLESENNVILLSDLLGLGLQLSPVKLSNPFVIKPDGSGIGGMKRTYVVAAMIAAFIAEVGAGVAKDVAKDVLTKIFIEYVYPRIKDNLGQQDTGHISKPHCDEVQDEYDPHY